MLFLSIQGNTFTELKNEAIKVLGLSPEDFAQRELFSVPTPITKPVTDVGTTGPATPVTRVSQSVLDSMAAQTMKTEEKTEETTAQKRTRRTKAEMEAIRNAMTTAPAVPTTATEAPAMPAVVDRETVRALGRQLCAQPGKGVDALMSVIETFGVKRANDIPESELPNYYTALTKAMA